MSEQDGAEVNVNTARESGMLRALGAFGGAWQLLWLISESGLRTAAGERPTSWPMLVLGISALAWLMVWPSLFGRWRSIQRTRLLQVIIVVSLVAAGFGLITDPRAVGDDGWYAGASVVNLAAGLAGLYLPRRMGIWVVLALVVGEAITIVVLSARGLNELPISVNLVYPVYSLALGLASVASRHALLTTARSEDASGTDLELKQRARASAEEFSASLNSAETRLHESVLNTLTAIVRGGLGNDRRTTARLRKRAAEAADVLQRLSLGVDVSGTWTGDLRVDARSAIDDLRQAGVRVQLLGALAPEIDPADSAYRAMGWAVREALLNVSRHADAKNVRLSGDLIRIGGHLRWRVLVADDGRGFDDKPLGFGTQSVVLEGLKRAGGRARIASTPGEGTEFLMEVPVSDAAVRSSQHSPGPFYAIGLPVLVAFSAFTVFVAGATWEFARFPAANLAALVILFAMSAVLLVALNAGRYAFAPWWAAVVVLIGVPLMARVEILAQATQSPTGDWSSEAGAALLFIVVATGPWWVGPPALVAWVLAQEGALGELTQPGTIVIVVAAILGWSLRRADARTSRLRESVQAERAAIAASQQRLSAAGHRYAAVDFGSLIELLNGIARGQIDPAAASVREECGRQEQMIRAVLPLRPEHVALHRDLVQLAVKARERDVELSINVATDVPTSEGLRRFDDAMALMALGRPGTTARASTAKSGSLCVFRLVVTIASADTARLPESCEVLDEAAELVAFEEVCADPSTLGTHGAQRDSPAGV